MSVIQSNVKELREINVEIKNLQTKIKQLKARSVAIEKDILTYLNEKEQPGVKFQNTAIIIENKEKSIKKSSKDVEKEQIEFLKNSGVSNAEEVLKKISEIKKGDAIQMQKLKIQNFKG